MALYESLRSLRRQLDHDSPILKLACQMVRVSKLFLPPIVAAGPCIAIRRQQVAGLESAQLVELYFAYSGVRLDFLQRRKNKRNILVSRYGYGKTSLLNCLASLIEEDERDLVFSRMPANFNCNRATWFRWKRGPLIPRTRTGDAVSTFSVPV
jgi:Flp pilus assembly CpaF family ATPase